MGTVYLVLDQTSKNAKSNQTISVSNKIWSQEMEKDFIKLVKEDRGLWDSGNAFYQKRSYKYYAYNRILNEMKVLWPNYEYLLTPLKLILKFRNLRTYYFRELKKMRMDSNFVPGWCHFEDLSFLEKAKPKFIHSTHGSPVVIQFPDRNIKSLKKVIRKNLKNPSVKSQIKRTTIEDSISDEEDNSEASHETAQSYSDPEEMSTKRPKKKTHNEEENSETYRETAQSVSDPEEMAIKPKKKRLTVKSVSNSKPPQKQLTVESVSNSQHFCNASPKIVTHDEAFANFVAKDLAKIPESQQKEELRFKIVELIHHCKMNTNFLSMDTNLGLIP